MTRATRSARTVRKFDISDSGYNPEMTAKGFRVGLRRLVVVTFGLWLLYDLYRTQQEIQRVHFLLVNTGLEERRMCEEYNRMRNPRNPAWDCVVREKAATVDAEQRISSATEDAWLRFIGRLFVYPIALLFIWIVCRIATWVVSGFRSA
jgi:hypothetical protein